MTKIKKRHCKVCSTFTQMGLRCKFLRHRRFSRFFHLRYFLRFHVGGENHTTSTQIFNCQKSSCKTQSNKFKIKPVFWLNNFPSFSILAKPKYQNKQIRNKNPVGKNQSLSDNINSNYCYHYHGTHRWRSLLCWCIGLNLKFNKCCNGNVYPKRILVFLRICHFANSLLYKCVSIFHSKKNCFTFKYANLCLVNVINYRIFTRLQSTFFIFQYAKFQYGKHNGFSMVWGLVRFVIYFRFCRWWSTIGCQISGGT